MFCSNCGYNAGDGKFCPSCGNSLSSQPAQAHTQQSQNDRIVEETLLWEGKPSGIIDKAKGTLNSITYKITSQRVIVTSGLLGKKEDEIELRKVKDIRVTQSLTEKLSKVGDIIILSTDVSEPVLKLENVTDAFAVKEIIRKAVNQRMADLNVTYRDRV